MEQQIELVRSAVTNPATAWVLFAHGTVVFLPGQHQDLAESAKETLAGWGPVKPGSPAGDFGVISFDGGWFVSCHHPDILTLVSAGELESEAPSDPEIGLFGRQKRDTDAAELSVVHIEPGQVVLASGAQPAEAELVGDLSDDPALAAAQKALLGDDPRALSDYLLAGDDAVFLEQESEGVTVYRETRMPIFLPQPWPELYLRKLDRDPRIRSRNGPKGLELRRRGALYTVTTDPIEEISAHLVVTGIDHTGKMRGAASQALVGALGQSIEFNAQQELAQTDRSLGTTVFTPRPGHDGGAGAPTFWLGHVVSTPLQSDASEWLKRAVFSTLNKARAERCYEVALVALGTNARMNAENCARAMLSSCQQWFSQQEVALHILFSLPSKRVREAFIAELRSQKLFFTEL